MRNTPENSERSGGVLTYKPKPLRQNYDQIGIRPTSRRLPLKSMGQMTGFMGVVIACLEKSGHDPIGIRELSDGLHEIARERPDLVERYDKALAARSAGEIERLWSECKLSLRAWHNLRINGITGRLHIGHSSRSYLLFPRVFQIWPPRGAQ